MRPLRGLIFPRGTLVVVRRCVMAFAVAREGLNVAVGLGNIVRITARLLINNLDDVVNVFHFFVAQNTTADDADFMTETALELDTIYTLINTAMPTNITYTSVEGLNVTLGELLPSTAWPTLVAGVNGSEMLPEMVSACVFHRTLKPRVRAAKFLPPFGESGSVSGAILPGTVATIQAFGDALTDSLVGPNIQLDYGAYNRVLATFTPVTQALVPARFRTQKRRRLGVGS